MFVKTKTVFYFFQANPMGLPQIKWKKILNFFNLRPGWRGRDDKIQKFLLILLRFNINQTVIEICILCQPLGERPALWIGSMFWANAKFYSHKRLAKKLSSFTFKSFKTINKVLMIKEQFRLLQGRSEGSRGTDPRKTFHGDLVYVYFIS